jgi:hypothetical protein
VFNTLGHFMGRIEVKNGASISNAIFTRFGQSGMYVVKQGAMVKTISVRE